MSGNSDLTHYIYTASAQGPLQTGDIVSFLHLERANGENRNGAN